MDIDRRFRTMLLSQARTGEADHQERLEKCCDMARGFALLQGGIAVISDMLYNRSYVYSGDFGRALGLEAAIELDSAFEDIIFSFIAPQDLLDRHILEIRYIEFIKSLPPAERNDYVQSGKINILAGKTPVPIIHQTRYLEITEQGNVNIGLCTYLPVGLELPADFDGHIFSIKSGLPLTAEQLRIVDDQILSPREKEVLHLLSLGLSSKQIAARLHLSANTIYRHRQNILRHLNAANTAEAVRIGVRMQLF